ncbi:DNA alkylation repair protein [Limibacter armeniacum]|uniref:DNA alkylation repair protein n=1 Tax=Limibacter armeniacum TaxID=466084 RepID=UPI002FE61989
MAEPLKNIYSESFIRLLSEQLESIIPDFNKSEFTEKIYDETWDTLELKSRMRHISHTLHLFLPKPFPKAVNSILALTQELKKLDIGGMGLAYMFLPDYIEAYGLEHTELSLEAFEEIVNICSPEFAIRPFILQDENTVMTKMYQWAESPNYLLRRFASEGCRPRLPWAMALPAFKNDPSPIMPILEKLKADDTLFVRKSVANNLNDISKDHPELLVKTVKKWQHQHQHTDWILKHASRTLLKQGHKDILPLFGLVSPDDISVELTNISSPITIGNDGIFAFTIQNNASNVMLLRIEYAIDYLKANGKHNRKVFKLSEITIGAKQTLKYSRKQSFANMTTRKHYKGLHRLSIIINGIEKATTDFELM